MARFRIGCQKHSRTNCLECTPKSNKARRVWPKFEPVVEPVEAPMEYVTNEHGYMVARLVKGGR